MSTRIIVHGGAGEIPIEDCEAHLSGCRTAAAVGWEVLRSGDSALDAVEAAVTVLEDDPVFDAGRGSYLNTDGHVEMDAIIMDGHDLNLGAIVGVRTVRYPISLARHVMESTPHNMFAGPGAEALANGFGLERCEPAWFVTPYTRRVWEEGHAKTTQFGTVGCVARDRDGNIATGTSTGGIRNKITGRIGDSPLVGCGAYADNNAAGVSASGQGEAIMKVVLSKTACELVLAGMSAQAAAQAAIKTLRDRTGGKGGLIAIDHRGDLGCACNTLRMSRAWVDDVGQIQAEIEPSDQIADHLSP